MRSNFTRTSALWYTGVPLSQFKNVFLIQSQKAYVLMKTMLVHIHNGFSFNLINLFKSMLTYLPPLLARTSVGAVCDAGSVIGYRQHSAERHMDIMYEPQLEHCSCQNMNIWKGKCACHHPYLLSQ